VELKELSDWELVRRCKEDDREAFRELLERYQHRAVRIALGMLHDPDDAQEVAQEAFTKVFTSIKNFKEEASFYTWLYRIVYNLSIDRKRQKSRQPQPEYKSDLGDNETDPIELLPADTKTDPYERTSDKELGARIQGALEELTPAHKAVILLRIVEGLSYEEISHILQCSRGTVMSRLHYARKRLQTILQQNP
jgi:RNA polymerase sigma-70 factor (ECF subfamily)